MPYAPPERRAKTSPGERLRQIIIAPTTLQDTAPLDYIEATVAAGYDGIGLRVHRSPGLPFHPVVGDAALIPRCARGSTAAGVRPLQLLPAARHRRGKLRARDGARRLVRREIRDRDGRRRGLVAPARQFRQDVRSRGAVRADLLARVRRDPPARDAAADRAADRGVATPRGDLHRPAASRALGRQPGRREGAGCEILPLRADLRRHARSGRAQPGAVRQARPRHARDAGRRQRCRCAP